MNWTALLIWSAAGIAAIFSPIWLAICTKLIRSALYRAKEEHETRTKEKTNG